MPYFKTYGASYGKIYLTVEISLRLLLGIFFCYLEDAAPFERYIHTEELWLYKNRMTDSYVPAEVLWLLVFLLPTILFFIHYIISRDRIEAYEATMAYTLCIGLNGVITNVIKIIVGRPRPDFLSRCFPDGVMIWPPTNPDSTLDMDGLDLGSSCTGNALIIQEGRKSFPSGHSSFSFSALGFLSLWLSGKLGVFSRNSGDGWRLVLSTLPVVGAACIALSRTCDYHHHWQDVAVGSLLGGLIAYMCYHQYYPSVRSRESQLCLRSNKRRPLPLIQQELPNGTFDNRNSSTPVLIHHALSDS